jgi:FkbM family methyltransferase
MAMMRHHQIQTVLDVGGNLGEYGAELRESGYSGRIISYEPTSEAYKALAARTKADANWVVSKTAIGERDGEVTINVAGNHAASSSLLPMLGFHEQCAPDARYVSKELVPLKTLDTALDGILQPDEKVLLKIDTQGYEHMVLAGASNILRQVELIECELSFVPLYEGQLLFQEMITLLKSLGFYPVQFVPGFSNPHTGYNLQADCTFARSANPECVLPE